MVVGSGSGFSLWAVGKGGIRFITNTAHRVANTAITTAPAMSAVILINLPYALDV